MKIIKDLKFDYVINREKLELVCNLNHTESEQVKYILSKEALDSIDTNEIMKDIYLKEAKKVLEYRLFRKIAPTDKYKFIPIEELLKKEKVVLSRGSIHSTSDFMWYEFPHVGENGLMLLNNNTKNYV